MRRLINILTWVSLALAAASVVLWFWPNLNFSWGHHGTATDYWEWWFNRGQISHYHQDYDCGVVREVLSMWQLTIAFSILPAIRLLLWLRSRRHSAAGGFPVEGASAQ